MATAHAPTMSTPRAPERPDKRPSAIAELPVEVFSSQFEPGSFRSFEVWSSKLLADVLKFGGVAPVAHGLTVRQPCGGCSGMPICAAMRSTTAVPCDHCNPEATPTEISAATRHYEHPLVVPQLLQT